MNIFISLIIHYCSLDSLLMGWDGRSTDQGQRKRECILSHARAGVSSRVDSRFGNLGTETYLRKLVRAGWSFFSLILTASRSLWLFWSPCSMEHISIVARSPTSAKAVKSTPSAWISSFCPRLSLSARLRSSGAALMWSNLAISPYWSHQWGTGR